MVPVWVLSSLIGSVKLLNETSNYSELLMLGGLQLHLLLEGRIPMKPLRGVSWKDSAHYLDKPFSLHYFPEEDCPARKFVAYQETEAPTPGLGGSPSPACCRSAASAFAERPCSRALWGGELPAERAA